MSFPASVAAGFPIEPEWGNEVISYLVPTGVIAPFGGASAPTNWLLCDGSTASRVTYSDLFNVIGVTYGVGDGSTTFNLPDLRARAPFGYKASDANHGTLGGVGGNAGGLHTLTLAETPAHDHGTNTSNQSADHTHVETAPGHRHAVAGAGANDWAFRYNEVGSTEGLMSLPYGEDGVSFSTMDYEQVTLGVQSANHQHNIDSAGGGTSHSIHDEFQTVNFIIKT